MARSYYEADAPRPQLTRDTACRMSSASTMKTASPMKSRPGLKTDVRKWKDEGRSEEYVRAELQKKGAKGSYLCQLVAVYKDHQPTQHTTPKKRRYGRLAATTSGHGQIQPKEQAVKDEILEEQAVKDEILDEDVGTHARASPPILCESEGEGYNSVPDIHEDSAATQGALPPDDHDEEGSPVNACVDQQRRPTWWCEILSGAN